MHDGQADDYLARIGARKPDRPDAAALAELTRRHLATVPFENLSIHLGEPIALDEDAFLDKLVTRRRGGFCYSSTGRSAPAGAARVRRHVARRAGVRARRRAGTAADHLALRVDSRRTEKATQEEEPWLVDVGFGRFVAEPLRLDERDDQTDPLGTVRLVETGDGDLDVLLDGTPQYRLDLRPRGVDEFEATCWFQQTHPTSHFASSLVCSLPTDDGRVTLSERLLVTTAGVSAPR